MAIDTAAKRRAVAVLAFYFAGPGVTPNAAKPVAWRQQAAWGYSGITPNAPVAGGLPWGPIMSKLHPYGQYVAITPSDSSDFAPVGSPDSVPPMCDAIYCGSGGVVVAVTQAGRTVSFTMVAGQILPIRTRRINSTNTTASLLVALYYL